ncbi:aldo/keto reductase [Acinetobacter qingfengensis]|uniref:2,5-diketo-D-gluconic acid reductase n=1 Tax=Acinetobacter qingfengensis TaxID=1262585 RepID=A0A1E7REJ9_9GAMM|nr:aldo/keto reductase [Acinetobacter qingfengensis]KAA8734764.1 aldo/keto reductase [Acinetobacter qingfengensis]OEY97682.1 2,5-diketo-D-gluconic acid reductase [Acinetobacter qingfengensis]
MKIPYLTLHDGQKIPALGFGTYSLNGQQGVKSIEAAIALGYRLLDSAFNYENEGAVGQAVKNSHIPREELFVSSKLPGRHHAYDEALVTIEESLYRAQLDYYDLYLIHWPNPKQGKYVEAWQALIEAQKRGYVRSIGVSNFLPEHIDVLQKETGILPVINQVELHPYFNQLPQRQYDQSKQIITIAWSPLGRGRAIASEEILTKIAQDKNKSVAQVVLRWQVQLGVIPIPKSASEHNQLANQQIFDFELSEQHMQAINALTRPDGRLQNQDPAVYEEF